MKGWRGKKNLWGSLSPDRRFWSEGARALLFTSRPIRLRKAWAFDGLRTACARSAEPGRAACGRRASRASRAPSGGRGRGPGAEGLGPALGRGGPGGRKARTWRRHSRNPRPPPWGRGSWRPLRGVAQGLHLWLIVYDPSLGGQTGLWRWGRRRQGACRAHRAGLVGGSFLTTGTQHHGDLARVWWVSEGVPQRGTPVTLRRRAAGPSGEGRGLRQRKGQLGSFFSIGGGRPHSSGLRTGR